MRRTPLDRLQFRKARVRQKISGSPERPRLAVYRSLNHVYAQLIDDTKGLTLVSASSLDEAIRDKKKSNGNQKAAALVGKMLAEKALKKNIKRVVFDRGGRIFHGCIKTVADKARENGLEF
jgi:large subunit ribosomal protein L18